MIDYVSNISRAITTGHKTVTMTRIELIGLLLLEAEIGFSYKFWSPMLLECDIVLNCYIIIMYPL